MKMNWLRGNERIKKKKKKVQSDDEPLDACRPVVNVCLFIDRSGWLAGWQAEKKSE